MLRQRQRLRRKQEQVYNQLNAETKLFQKTYYNPALLAEDELSLRESFIRLNQSNETTHGYAQLAFFGAYWPLTYVLPLWYCQLVKFQSLIKPQQGCRAICC